jgi:hypothetical protein
MNEILRQDRKQIILIGISTGYWKNSYTGDNFSTINILYTKDDDPITYMLKTVLFSGSKNDSKMLLTATNFRHDSSYILFVLGHCINLVVHHSIEDCMQI